MYDTPWNTHHHKPKTKNLSLRLLLEYAVKFLHTLIGKDQVIILAVIINNWNRCHTGKLTQLKVKVLSQTSWSQMRPGRRQKYI